MMMPLEGSGAAFAGQELHARSHRSDHRGCGRADLNYGDDAVDDRNRA